MTRTRPGWRGRSRTSPTRSRPPPAPHEFTPVPDNDVNAVVAAVADTIAAVPVDAKLLRESGYTALGLADYYRTNGREVLKRAALSDDAGRAYNHILESVSHQVLAVVRVSPEAHTLALADLTDRLDSVWLKINDPGGLYRDGDAAANLMGTIMTASPR